MTNAIEQLRPQGEELTHDESATMLRTIVSDQRHVQQRRTGYWIAAACIAILGLTTAAWAYSAANGPTDSHRATTGHCVSYVRYDGVIYEGWTFARLANSQPAGDAELSACDDTTPNSQGTYFPKDPRRVQVWSFAQVDRSQVVGVSQGNGFTIYFAEGLSENSREQALRRLGLTR